MCTWTLCFIFALCLPISFQSCNFIKNVASISNVKFFLSYTMFVRRVVEKKGNKRTTKPLCSICRT